MEPRTLVLKVISCNGLGAFNFFHKLSIYAVVYITKGKNEQLQGKYEYLQRQKTMIDREGGENPEWNHMMKFDLKSLVDNDDDDDCGDYYLSFDLHSDGVVYGKRVIGKVRVLLKDLIDESKGDERFVRYQVRTPGGRKPNGILYFSYKVKGKTKTKRGTSPKVRSSYEANGKTKYDEKLSTRKTRKDEEHISSKVDIFYKVNEILKNNETVSQEISFPSEKICYPTIEADEEPEIIRYPSLDDVLSPLSSFSSPSPDYQYNAIAYFNVMTTPHQHFSATPEPWYVSERTGYGFTNRDSLGIWTN